MSDENESKYKKIETPNFRSSIPSYLIDKLSESEKHIISSVSIIEQTQKFLVENILEVNEATREIDVRTQKIEGWKDKIISKTGAIVGLIVLIVPVVLTETVKSFVSNFWK